MQTTCDLAARAAAHSASLLRAATPRRLKKEKSKLTCLLEKKKTNQSSAFLRACFAAGCSCLPWGGVSARLQRGGRLCGLRPKNAPPLRPLPPRLRLFPPLRCQELPPSWGNGGGNREFWRVLGNGPRQGSPPLASCVGKCPGRGAVKKIALEACGHLPVPGKRGLTPRPAHGDPRPMLVASGGTPRPLLGFPAPVGRAPRRSSGLRESGASPTARAFLSAAALSSKGGFFAFGSCAASPPIASGFAVRSRRLNSTLPHRSMLRSFVSPEKPPRFACPLPTSAAVDFSGDAPRCDRSIEIKDTLGVHCLRRLPDTTRKRVGVFHGIRAGSARVFVKHVLKQC